MTTPRQLRQLHSNPSLSVPGSISSSPDISPTRNQPRSQRILTRSPRDSQRLEDDEPGEHHPLLNNVLATEKQLTTASSIKAILSSKLNILLVALPLGIMSSIYEWGDVPTFVLNFLAVIPQASLLGLATEELSLVTSQTIGGLLNATFGNLVEMVVAITALREGLIDVVQASLLGSILSNLLFVLGLCFLLGGIYYPVQRFNMTAAQTSASMLTLSVTSIIIPAAFAQMRAPKDTPEKELLYISRAASILLLLSYIMYLLFQLKTHSHLYEDETEEGEEPEERTLTVPVASVLLVVISIMVSVSVEYLVGSIEGLSESWNISKVFVGLILLPAAGNAPEHASAVVAAMQNKMGLSLGIAMGSSMQIALLVVPVTVLAGWFYDKNMTLHFSMFETVVMFLTVYVVSGIVNDGKSHWLEGALLLIVYAIVGISFYNITGELP